MYRRKNAMRRLKQHTGILEGFGFLDESKLNFFSQKVKYFDVINHFKCKLKIFETKYLFKWINRAIKVAKKQ